VWLVFGVARLATEIRLPRGGLAVCLLPGFLIGYPAAVASGLRPPGKEGSRSSTMVETRTMAGNSKVRRPTLAQAIPAVQFGGVAHRPSDYRCRQRKESEYRFPSGHQITTESVH
jgi:hypothetical protein